MKPDGRLVLLPLVGLSLLLVLTGPLQAAPTDTDPIEIRFPVSLSMSAGETATASLSFSLADGWHINAHRPSLDYLIPTTLRLVENDDLDLVRVEYPPSRTLPLSFAEQPLEVYSGSKQIQFTLRARPSIEPGKHTVNLEFRYQPCRDDRCLRPGTRRLSLTVRVPESTGPGSDASSTTVGMGELLNSSGPSARQLRNFFESGGIALGLLVVFLLGLSLNLTPCVYPMIPITVGYFGTHTRDGQAPPLWSRVRDGILFVLGMALIYSLLGGFAGYTGAILGRLLQQPVVLLFMALLMVVLASGMFGLFSFRLPQPVHEESRSLVDMLGSFGMGMTLGVAAAPCLAPATVALLAFVGQQGSYWVGAGLFFVLALGLGLPYVALAVFSSSLSSLPASGKWLNWVEYGLGCMVLGVALYFLWPLVPDPWFGYLVLAWLTLSGLLLVTAFPPDHRAAYLIRSVLVILVFGIALLWTTNNLMGHQEGIQWIRGREILTSSSSSIPGPAVVYVSADWCVPCKELQIRTFPNQQVQELMNRVRAVKLDVTNPPPEPVNRWMMDHEILGVPTMVFLDQNGQEIHSLRVEGFIGARRLIQRLRRIVPEQNGSSPWPLSFHAGGERSSPTPNLSSPGTFQKAGERLKVLPPSSSWDNGIL